MPRPEEAPTKGILRPDAIDRKLRLSRHSPSDEMAFFVEHFWMVAWDLRGEKPYWSETLPFPSAHVVIERGRSELWGVVTRRFARLLEGRGRVFGIKFRPGASRQFIRRQSPMGYHEVPPPGSRGQTRPR